MSGTDIKKIKFLSVADNGVLQTFDTEYINVIGANISYLGNAITLDFQTPLSGYQPLNNNLNGLSSLSYSSGTPFIKMTGAGTFAFDTNTYLTGLTIGSTGIASGTSTRILYNNGGVLGEYLVTGTGTTAVLSTSPTFTTDITTPLIIGGTGANQVLTFQNTTGATTSAGGAYLFKAGNLGADLITINQRNFIFSPINATAGAITSFTFTTPANTSQTASTNIPNFRVTGSTKTWAAGTITSQYWNYFSANTAAFASASTITNSYGLYVEAATAGTNATITNNFSLGTDGNVAFGGNRIWQGMTSGYDASNYSLYKDASTTILNSGSSLLLRTNNNANNIISISLGNIAFSPSTNNGESFTFTIPTGATGMTASTERVGFKIDGGSKTWAAGTLTTQRNLYLTSQTVAFASASTLTNYYGAYFEAATVGTNATITNNYAAGFSGNIELTSSGTTKMKILSGSGVNTYIASEGAGSAFGSISAHNVVFYRGNSLKLTLQSSSFLFSDAYNIEFNATTGTKIGTAPSQKIGFWNATPIVQPTTAVVAATFVANTSAIANDTATFDGYTIGQIVKALRNAGLLA